MSSGENTGAANLYGPALARFGHHLSVEQQDMLRQAARQLHGAVDALRAFELTNADEPVTAFAVADRED